MFLLCLWWVIWLHWWIWRWIVALIYEDISCSQPACLHLAWYFKRATNAFLFFVFLTALPFGRVTEHKCSSAGIHFSTSQCCAVQQAYLSVRCTSLIYWPQRVHSVVKTLLKDTPTVKNVANWSSTTNSKRHFYFLKVIFLLSNTLLRSWAIENVWSSQDKYEPPRMFWSVKGSQSGGLKGNSGHLWEQKYVPFHIIGITCSGLVLIQTLQRYCSSSLYTLRFDVK